LAGTHRNSNVTDKLRLMMMIVVIRAAQINDYFCDSFSLFI